jgi:hypothetical protein
MHQEVTAFFKSYRDAFNALNGRAVAELYAEPSGIAQDGVYTHWSSRAVVEQNMNALCELYQKRGFVRAEFAPGQFLDQGPHHAIADLLWRIEWAGEQAPWQFNTSYNLVRTGKGWRVLLCTAYTETILSSAEKQDAA